MIIPDASRKIKTLKEQNGLRLAKALKDFDQSSFSEFDLARAWLDKQKNTDNLYEKGWYDPPPEGAIILCGKPQDNYSRVSAPSFRVEPMWPRTDIMYEETDILTVYTSPVCKTTKLIGDFGLSLYRGNDRKIQDHFENVLTATIDIAHFARVGMTFSEFYAKALEHTKITGFENALESQTDRAGTNIGHSIPLSYGSDETHNIIQQAHSFDDVRSAISGGRKFINRLESQLIEPIMSFTVEPRLSAAGMPGIFYHFTVVIEAGSVYICHGFNPVLEAFGMGRLLKYLPR